MDAHPQLRHPQPTREGTAEIENRGQINVPRQIEGEKWMRTLNCAIHCPREGTAEIENRGQTDVPKQIKGEKWMRTLNCATHCPRERALLRD
jgi:hypothetical protein